MKDNSIRRAVREGRAALGTQLKEFASRGMPWIIEASGFDYVAIDHEHGAFDLDHPSCYDAHHAPTLDQTNTLFLNHNFSDRL